MSRETTRTELEKKNRELSILNQIANALNREVNLADALQVSMALIVDLFDLNTGWLFLYDEEAVKFYTSSTHNLPPVMTQNPALLRGSCYCQRTYRDGDMQGAANINAISCSRLEDLTEGTEGLRYHASVPLYANEKKLGILNAVSTDWTGFSEDELQLLHTVGDLVSMAIERAQLFQTSIEIGTISERNRIAREIHDTLAQGLAAVALQLEVADSALDSTTNTETVRKAINKALNLTRQNIEEARHSVIELREEPLAESSLAEAVKKLVHHEDIESQIIIESDIAGNTADIPNRVAISLYRVVQEAVNNVIQHANATKLFVMLDAQGQQILLKIKDNGQGFDVTQVPDGHFGLIGMNERVKLLNGTMEVASTPEVGTQLFIRVPMEPIS